MSEYEFTTEDMAIMGREGTRKDFILMLRRPSAGAAKSEGTGTSSAMPADHVPGAWPAAAAGGIEGRTTCNCSRCGSYTEDRPALPELLQQTEEYLNAHQQENP